jgi:hypothetical protein
MAVPARQYINSAVVTFPASKTAAAATITGSVLTTYEATGAGGANVYLSGDTVSGDTLTVKTYVSFDTGTSWVQVDEDGVGHNGTFEAGGGSSYRRFFIPYAPRVRVDAVFDGAATLPTGHGLAVNVEALEYEPEAKRTVFTNVLDIGDSEALEQFAITAIGGDTMTVNSPRKMLFWIRQANTAIFGDSLTITLQGSVDASNWWTVQNLTIQPLTGDSIYRNVWEVIERQDFPKYVRLYMNAGDSQNFWFSGHGVQFYAISYE